MVWKLRLAAAARVTRVVLFVAMLSFLGVAMYFTWSGDDLALIILGGVLVLFLTAVPPCARWIASRRVHTACGASARPPAPSGAPAFRGVVKTAAPTTGPLTGRSCAGFAVELTASDHHVGPTLARFGKTEGLELVANDGATVHIPAGAIRLLGGRAQSATQRPVPPPDIFGDAAASLCPADGGEERIIAEGDHLEVFGTLEPVQIGGGYRDGAWSQQPTGLPVLRIASRTA